MLLKQLWDEGVKDKRETRERAAKEAIQSPRLCRGTRAYIMTLVMEDFLIASFDSSIDFAVLK